MDGYIVSLDGSSAPVSREAVEDALSSGKLLWLDLRMPDDDAVAMLRSGPTARCPTCATSMTT